MTELELKMGVISYVVLVTSCKDMLFQSNNTRHQGDISFICLLQLITQSNVLSRGRLIVSYSSVSFSLLCFNTDTDECPVSDSCDQNMLCVNSVGSYSCSCRQGYRAIKTQMSCIGNYQWRVLM